MTDANEEVEGGNSLFTGVQFWISHNVPQKTRFKELILQHGGIIRLQEKDADIKLVDHIRKLSSPAPNTFSYRYVEESIREGRLLALEAYRVGPGAARPAGATHLPTKGSRASYTLEDDQNIWDYMDEYLRTNRRSWAGGNLVYKDFAEQYPRHTWQSWRDRWRRKLAGNSRPGGELQTTNQGTSLPAATTSHEPDIALPSTTDHMPAAKSPQTTREPESRKRKRIPDDEPSESRLSDHQDSSRHKRTPPPSARQVVTTATHLTETPEMARRDKGEAVGASNPLAKDPETEVDSLFLELPFLPSSPEEDGGSSQPDIDAWIDNRLRTGKAQNDAQIIEALRCTSMDPEVADQVLKHLVAGKGIPDDIPGVWTAEDDRCLEGKDDRGARDIRRVLEKHGPEFFNTRWEYLSMARDAGLENDKNN